VSCCAFVTMILMRVGWGVGGHMHLYYSEQAPLRALVRVQAAVAAQRRFIPARVVEPRICTGLRVEEATNALAQPQTTCSSKQMNTNTVTKTGAWGRYTNGDHCGECVEYLRAVGWGRVTSVLK
jgi:hypothetical protein